MLKFRSATVDDSNAILDIYTPFIANTTVTFEIEVPTHDDFRHRVESLVSNFPYIVAEDDGKIIAYAYAHAYRERAAYRFDCELSVYVSPLSQRRGIGKRLYDILIAALKEMNYHTAYAVVALPNENSQIFHDKYGFVLEGYSRNTGYKFDRWLDTATYSYNLLPYDQNPKPTLCVNQIDLNKIIYNDSLKYESD